MNTILDRYQKKIAALLLATVCLSGSGLAARAQTVPFKAASWHPGHYVFIERSNPTDDQIRNAVAGSSKFRGVQIMFDWNQLDGGGAPNVGRIQQILTLLKTMNKHLVLQLQTKTFGAGNCVVPNYIIRNGGSAKPGGGKYSAVYKTSTGSLDPVLWDPVVTNNMMAFYGRLGNALANYRDADALESLILPETAQSTTDALINQSNAMPFSDKAYTTEIARGFWAMNQSLPHTEVIQYVNFPRSALAQICSDELNQGVGLGGPDSDPSSRHPGLQAPNGIYGFYPQLAGKVPLGTAVQSSDAAANPGVSGVKAILHMAQNELKLNYIYWLDSPSYIADVAKVLNDPAEVPSSDPAGGLKSQYPSSVRPYMGN